MRDTLPTSTINEKVCVWEDKYNSLSLHAVTAQQVWIKLCMKLA